MYYLHVCKYNSTFQYWNFQLLNIDTYIIQYNVVLYAYGHNSKNMQVSFWQNNCVKLSSCLSTITNDCLVQFLERMNMFFLLYTLFYNSCFSSVWLQGSVKAYWCRTLLLWCNYSGLHNYSPSSDIHVNKVVSTFARV